MIVIWSGLIRMRLILTVVRPAATVRPAEVAVVDAPLASSRHHRAGEPVADRLGHPQRLPGTDLKTADVFAGDPRVAERTGLPAHVPGSQARTRSVPAQASDVEEALSGLCLDVGSDPARVRQQRRTRWRGDFQPDGVDGARLFKRRRRGPRCSPSTRRSSCPRPIG